MSTVFIAVQCFQCSTMQVKQRKKSSNKRTCVVCNTKQSVRKVFSQAFMAKDVRQFVQTFNMSRQFVEQQQELREQQTLGPDHSEVHQPSNKRTDWSEYIDADVNDPEIGDDEGELCEPNFVTELPKPLFNKPKLRNNYSADCENGEKLQRPVFRKRNTKNFNNPGKEPGSPGTIGNGRVGDNQHNDDIVDNCFAYGRSNSTRTDIMKRSSKWDSCDDYGDHGFTDSGPSSVMAKLKRPVSKWSNFIDDEESRWEESVYDAAFETKLSDEIVEDDVHPDFM